jgi:hypothetical protein
MKFLFLKKLFLKHRNKQGYDFILKSQLISILYPPLHKLLPLDF